MYRATLPSPTRDVTNLLKRFVTLFKLLLYYLRTHLGCDQLSFVVQVFKISETTTIIGVMNASHVDDITHFQSNMGIFISKTNISNHVLWCLGCLWQFHSWQNYKIFRSYFWIELSGFCSPKKKAQVEFFIKRINS